MRIVYFRVSTGDQSVEAQRHALGGKFDREYVDHGVSGGVMAADRPGFAKLLEQVRAGDVLHVYALDRLGRDAIDVQTTVRKLLDADVVIEVHGGIGRISRGVGEVIVAVVAQLADLERQKILARTADGRAAARASLAATGLTQHGKESLGRPKAQDAAAVIAWRQANGASIADTAQHFGIGLATVKRYNASQVA